MIGLLATACSSLTGRRWRTWFERPPAPAELDAAFAHFADAFLLDGSGSRFMQDKNDLDGDEVPISQLLIDAPGANTLKKNLDHFVRRGSIKSFSRRGAAIALFTLQDFAPSGGAGHRTSLRGGGPLSTLVIPGAAEGRPDSLWRMLWLNTASPEQDGDAEGGAEFSPDRVFPWLVPSRVSESGQPTTPGDVHPLQAYWGMPRRIQLLFEPNTDRLRCDLTGEIDSVIVSRYRTRPYGTNYSAFVHSLSPYYRAKGSPEWLPIHGQPGRIGYRHWIGLIENSEGEGRRTAEAVTVARRRLVHQSPSIREQARLLAAGFDMDNMKARDFIESEMPLHLLEDEIARQFTPIISNLVEAASEVQRLLVRQINNALFAGEAKIDAGRNGLARDRFWAETEQPFHRLADEFSALLKASGGDEARRAEAQARVRTDWLQSMRRQSLRIFDDLVPVADLAMLRLSDIQRIIQARKSLSLALSGYGKAGVAIFDRLGQVLPQPAKTSRKSKEAS